jgi:phosphoenolpyruvate-protein phosphotransferase (PTS system enzyme I)
MLQGIPAAPGIAIGHSFLFRGEELVVPYRVIMAENVQEEQERFHDALESTKVQITSIQKNIAEEMGQEHGAIFNAHLMVLDDQTLIGEVIQCIAQSKQNVEAAFQETVSRYIEAFRRIEDRYLRERVADIDDVRKRVLHNLLGKQQTTFSTFSEPVIIVAKNLSPSETAQMSKEHILAFATDIGAMTSHTAIMAKALEIPAVVGLESATQLVQHGDLLIVDGLRGELHVNPDEETIERYKGQQGRIAVLESDLERLKDLPAETLDAHRVVLAANIEKPFEVASALSHGASGIGLYRTEFFYLNRSDLPAEEEQFQSYKEVVERVSPEPVIIRTLDLGGDKFASQLNLPREMNPFMGWRAIRFCLAHPNLFRAQLRAILRASAFGQLKIMYPMISGLDELQQANTILCSVQDELRVEGVAFDEQIDVGAMIEVPSAAMICDLLAAEVDFFSIGTNDLIQYALAVDRVNAKIAYLYDPAHPAVLRLIKQIIDVGHAHGLWVGLCGEMAGDPILTLLLLGMGLDEFSTSPVLIPEVKRVIRSVEYRQAQALTEAALKLSTGEAIRAFTTEQLNTLIPELVE